ncbi:unnamed protein product [Pleuronectes platessa]|uniref:Uncharacterized protein n=1 Tax=Pleuronectes platessa TaxID=8262 RepID=A0A9N7U2T7_PLEPL|nr:unnamed protein product [Pleuronectes platessa]
MKTPPPIRLTYAPANRDSPCLICCLLNQSARLRSARPLPGSVEKEGNERGLAPQTTRAHRGHFSASLFLLPPVPQTEVPTPSLPQ